jgi:uncharacterized protein with HEPN domain
MIKKPEIFLTHILGSIDQIERSTKDLTAASFRLDRDKQNSVIREFEIIGEAAKNIPAGFRRKYPQIPWARAVGMRNKLIHEYFGVDLGLIWKTVKEDLPRLKIQITEILTKINKGKLIK